ncbi:hypothetical protein AB833_24150 [Chromatiales bacterium (ex Bugula neritina AB1)]|nr:hypothetical protein AB833_24150 [Chromatiales bacterium (ex Bugula neritina AB1)]
MNKITAIIDSVDTDLSQQFICDDFDRLNFATGNYGEDTYGYDPISNRLSFARDGQSENYQYGSGSHRLESVSGETYFSACLLQSFSPPLNECMGSVIDEGQPSSKLPTGNSPSAAITAMRSPVFQKKNLKILLNIAPY